MLNKLTSFLPKIGLLAILILHQMPVWAQCAMCKASAASKDQAGNVLHSGINTGILYLLALPFILILVVGGIWYFRARNGVNQEAGTES